MGQFWQLVATSKLLGVNDTSLTDYRKQHDFWFSFEKKRQFRLTAKKLENKHIV